MALRKIICIEDELLRKKSRPVEKFDEKLHKLLDDMAETMYNANGVGLAAPQVAVLRRVAVASYEVELNLVIHSRGGVLTLEVEPDRVRLVSRDVGPGIPDVELAMREGYSTANEEARSLGFGAGMGLPNMKRNADQFAIESAVGVGTTIEMSFCLQ